MDISQDLEALSDPRFLIGCWILGYVPNTSGHDCGLPVKEQPVLIQ